MVRLFIAIDITDSCRDALSSLQNPLIGMKGRLAIVDPSLLHITLKFLGEVPGDRITSIISALKTIRSPSYEVDIRGIASNNPRRPRVIWTEVRDGGRSAQLAGMIESVLEPLGFPSETRPFRPHITLARVKEFHPDLPGQLREISSSESSGCASMPVSSFLLKKSTLTPRGPVYETLAEVTL
ncbi:hypothetical protein RJ53_00100 [Methanocalculus chunghsingensis]|uniref:RNA 2',3'-cyclic phosphodiesterase n=1 Tax=Methanocalculus chunghsingensis TaxID=156457 RepID=A0A8J8B5V2_9EURY|nr:RNA 2',3'-cyclic phosphodiesterase [Methanocalculus chunghsingensis]MBR1367977.1 hypothetical protein [Methanocalculus chunghsingensis]